MKNNLECSILVFLELIAGPCGIWNADYENKSSFIKHLNTLWLVKSVFHKQLFPDRMDNFSTLVFLRWHLRIYLVFREKEKKIIAKVSLLSTVVIVKSHCAKPTKYAFWNTEIVLRNKQVQMYLISSENLFFSF